jgi:subtilisin family serine protease
VAGADIHAPRAWALSRGAGVTVAVVDTGADLGHEDLAGQFAAGGHDWVDGDNDPSDANGHGTHVSGTIAAVPDNGLGITGVAPAAKILPLRALDATGSGSMSNVAAAMEYAGDHGARIVNASLGGPYSQAVSDAIAAHPNTLYVVAAGNSAADDDDPAHASYPCALRLANVLCVGASDESDQPASFSNHGVTSVDLYAPGTDIVSTYADSPDSYALLSGTSMATPTAAGVAALALATNPGASAEQVRSALISTVDPRAALANLCVSGGRLDAPAAVARLAGVASAPPTAAVPAPTPAPPPAPAVAPAPPVATPTPGTGDSPVRNALPPPALRGLRVRGSLRSRRGRLRVTFSLSRPATVRFMVERRGAHRAAGTWSVRARSGANAYWLGRRLPTQRTLPRGAYSLAVGVAATASTARFSVR